MAEAFCLPESETNGLLDGCTPLELAVVKGSETNLDPDVSWQNIDKLLREAINLPADASWESGPDQKPRRFTSGLSTNEWGFEEISYSESLEIGLIESVFIIPQADSNLAVGLQIYFKPNTPAKGFYISLESGVETEFKIVDLENDPDLPPANWIFESIVDSVKKVTGPIRSVDTAG